MSDEGAVGTARSRWPWALPVFTVVAVGVSMARRGAVLREGNLAISWQLVELPVLRDDPLGSVWYLHIQPPLFNLAIGSVLRWSPTPAYGTLVVGFLACLALTGVLLVDVMVRWRVPAVAAGLIASLAVALPAPISSIVLPSYEVPLATLLALAVWLAQRHLDRPGPVPLFGLAATLTGLALTRSLFHPGWVLVVLALALAARPVPWRTAVAVVALPLVLVGGWMGKNQALFGEPTLSSWFGFNLQRGVVAPIDAGAVAADVEDGVVTPRAQEPPFGTLAAYGIRCDGDRRHPALDTEVKVRTDFAEVPNFNNPCYLPLYAESSDNASTLLRRHPGDYLRARSAAYLLAVRTAEVGVDDPVTGLAGGRQAETTWMDRLGDVVLLPVTAHVSMDGWNIPLLAGVDELEVEVSPTLAVGILVVLGRGLVAVVALARRWRTRHDDWTGEDLGWVVVASAVGLVVVLAGLVELGENDRFRATVDPFLVALPLALVARRVAAALTARRSVAPD